MMPIDTLHNVSQQLNWFAIADLSARWSTVFVGIINLLLVLYIFRSNIFFNRSSLIIEKRSTWFRELAITPNLKNIQLFYSDSLLILEEGKKQIIQLIKTDASHQSIIELSQKVVSSFNDKITCINKEFLDVIAALDDAYGQELYLIFDKLQDDILPQFDELILKADKCECEFKEILRKHRILLYKTLHDYDIEVLLKPIQKKINKNKTF
jgi:hypothetical protein